MKEPAILPEELEALLADLRLVAPSIALSVHPQWATASAVHLGILVKAFSQKEDKMPKMLVEAAMRLSPQVQEDSVQHEHLAAIVARINRDAS